MSGYVVPEPSAPPTGRVETLVAVEWDSRVVGPVEVIVERIRRHARDEGAVRGVTTVVRGDGRPEHRIAIDTGLVRNTDAHGIGFGCGYVVHIEP